MRNLRNPRLVPKATYPSSPRLSRLKNLGTRWKSHELSTPAHPIKDRPLLIMMWFLFTLYALVPVIRLTLLCIAHKYRLICKNWNTLISCLFWKVFEYVPLEKVIAYKILLKSFQLKQQAFIYRHSSSYNTYAISHMASMLNMETLTLMQYAKVSKGSPSTLSQYKQKS